MRLDDIKPSENVEDRRGQGGGFGFPRGGGGGGRFPIPMGGRGGLSIRTIILLVILYFGLKLIFGIDLLEVINGGGVQNPTGTNTEITLPNGRTDITDAGGTSPTTPTTPTSGGSAASPEQFVGKVLATTETVWSNIFQGMGETYEKPKLVLFNGFVESACGMAQSAMGPFYCPNDRKVYIDLSFYQDMKNKIGAPGDAAQAYVIAHEVGHHVQTLLGIAGKVTEARARASEEEGNALSVRMELQADCLAGIWAKEADARSRIFEEGDIDEALNAASQIGDDRLQKRSQGYVVPESFTHGTSEQRVRWFKTGLKANDLKSCDTFQAGEI